MKIGVSSCFFHADPKRAVFKGKTLLYLEQSMSYWLMREGVLVFMIPQPEEGSPVQLKDLVNEMDALVLQGGSDVCPRSYGEEALKPEWEGDYIRDQYEIALSKEFMDQDKPVLGICRGAQILNVAFGGTLYQDIETQIPGARNHRNWDIYDQNFHHIRFEKGSMLEKLYPKTVTAKVNTVHHQAIKALGKGLIVEAKSNDDGIIEAIRHEGKPFVYAVQWHPEFQDKNDTSLLDGRAVLRTFLNEARNANA
jgi:putative glutamine amidotransferase